MLATTMAMITSIISTSSTMSTGTAPPPLIHLWSSAILRFVAVTVQATITNPSCIVSIERNEHEHFRHYGEAVSI